MPQQVHLIGRIFSKLIRASESNSRIISVGVASITLRLSGASLTLILTVVLARVLGPSGYGVYSYAAALATLTAVLSQLGVPTLVVRHTARYQSMFQWDKMRGLFIRASQVVVASSIVGVGIFLVVLAIFEDLIPSSQMHTVVFALVLIPMVSFNNVGGASLRGLGFAVRGQLAEQLFRPGLFLVFLVILILIAGQDSISAPKVMAVHAAAAFLAFLIGMLLLRKAIPSELHAAVSNFADWSRWRRSLYPLSILAGLQIINGQTDILMLGIFASAEDVGVYRVAYQGASLVNLTLFAIGLTVEPTIARLQSRRDKQRLQEIVQITARMAFGISLAMTMFLVVFGQGLITTVFGAEFSESYVPLAILCGGQVALAFAGWAVLILNMSGNEGITARFTAYAAVANIVANLVLIPPFGLYGAAIATASTVFLWKVGLGIVAEKITGIRSFIFPGKSLVGES